MAFTISKKELGGNKWILLVVGNSNISLTILPAEINKKHVIKKFSGSCASPYRIRLYDGSSVFFRGAKSTFYEYKPIEPIQLSVNTDLKLITTIVANIIIEGETID